MDVSTIVAGLLTLIIFTFLYKDNPFYKMAESLLIGVSIGYVLVITWSNTLMDMLFEPLFQTGELTLFIPLLLGLMMLGRFTNKTAALSRIPIAVMIGSGAGIAIPTMLYNRTIKQLTASVMPLFTADGTFNFTGIIVIVGLLSTLAYFILVVNTKGSLVSLPKLVHIFLCSFLVPLSAILLCLACRHLSVAWNFSYLTSSKSHSNTL